MKKCTALLLVLVLTFSLVGCNTSSDEQDAEAVKAYCYVGYVDSHGFVADIGDIGRVYIEYPNAKEQIKLYDTVIIEYVTSQLTETDGTYIGVAGGTETYSHTLKSLKSLRVADPSKGDHVFG